MIKGFINFFIGFLILNSATLKAQNKDKEKLSPKTYFDINDFDRALEGYLELWPSHQRDMTINLNIATCYLNVNGDKSKALPYLHFVLKNGNTDEEVIFMLGQAYMYAQKFDEALKYFNSFRAKTNPKNFDLADLYISYCNNAKEMTSHPLNVIFENLGKEINTKFPDYYPFVVENDSTLYFTSRRDSNTGNITSWQGYYTSDIYTSKALNGKFTKARNIGTFINTPEDEQCVFVSPDGRNMIVYIDNLKLKIADDLFLTSAEKGKTFTKPIGFNELVNSDYSELEGCFTSPNLNTLIISSDRPGGLGETDLYIMQRSAANAWDTPINLGPNINTPYRESFPVFDEATQTLYFASEGKRSMGGFDIFKSKYDAKTKTFGPSENIGYPINTTDDDMIFSLAANKRNGYVSMYRPEGLGDLDLYKVIFRTTLKGKVISEDSSVTVEGTVELYNRNGNLIETQTIQGTKNNFEFTTNTGKYILKTKINGQAEMIEEILLDDQKNYKGELIKDIVIKKPVPAETIPTKQNNKSKPGTKKVK